MMIVNSTCVQANGTDTCFPPSSPAGLAVGLSLFFLILLIGVGVIVYKYHKKKMVQFGQRESHNKEVCADSLQAEEHHYTSMTREHTVEHTGGQTEEQTPVYENLTIQTGYKRSFAKQSRSSDPPEEDLYLQCDSIDEGIYSNDLAFNSMLPDPQGEDLYVVPHS